MFAFSDQLGRIINLTEVPQRIISLVPSQTELLHYLGLEKEVVGITKFCIHPQEWFRTKTRIGGTKNVQLQIVHQLKPDLIIANKEENVKEQIEQLARDYQVWTSNVNNLEDAYEMITAIGKITNKNERAAKLTHEIRAAFTQLQYVTSGIGQRAAYLIWKDPYMTVGGDTFISAMMHAAGLKNVFAGRIRYPEVSIQELKAANCNCLLLSSEPYPFKENHIKELQTFLPGVKIMLADGEMFSWYGSRLLYAPAYFQSLQKIIHQKSGI